MMNLINLKSTWKRFKLLNTMERIDNKVILAIIEQHNHYASRTLLRQVINPSVFIVLIIICQGV